MEQKIEIHSIKIKTSEKSGKDFFSVDTSEGFINVFDIKLAEQLKQYVGKEVNVELEQNGKFTNLKAIKELPKDQTRLIPKKEISYTENREAKDAIFLTSYAKDLCVECMKYCVGKDTDFNLHECMDECVDAINTAYNNILDNLKGNKQEKKTKEPVVETVK